MTLQVDGRSTERDLTDLRPVARPDLRHERQGQRVAQRRGRSVHRRRQHPAEGATQRVGVQRGEPVGEDGGGDPRGKGGEGGGGQEGKDGRQTALQGGVVAAHRGRASSHMLLELINSIQLITIMSEVN